MISYDQWMRDTYSLTSPRSDFLKALDAAIKGGNRDAIKTALDRWRFEQSKQGKDWRKSVRNDKGAVTQLYRDVNTLDRRRLTTEEREALAFIAREQSMALQRQFAGRQLTFKATTLIGMARGAGTAWQRFKTGADAAKDGAWSGRLLKNGVENFGQTGAAAASSASAKVSGSFATIQQKVRQFCAELCPGIDADHVFGALNLGGVAEFAAGVAPFVGAISSGGKALAGWAGCAKSAYTRYKVTESRYAFAPGDPAAALDAVITLIDREIGSNLAKARVHTLAFTGKMLGAFGDGGVVTGPAVGLLELLAQIFQTVVEYVVEYKECAAGNEMLRLGALNLDLFKVCPVLGCYFLVMQDHSTIINFAVGDYGTPHWTFDVERMVAVARVALEKAQQCLATARYEIVGFATAKGVKQPDFKHKTAADKVTGAKDALVDKIMSRIDAWFEKPTRPPKVDATRIVGFGSAG